MSSHHIVREKQEPALLALGLDNFPDEPLGQLLEWSPTVIATPDTVDNLASRGIKIDLVFAGKPGGVPQSDVKLISAGHGNLADAALTFLAENDYPSVNIITDNLNLSDFERFVNRLDLVIFHNNQRIYPVMSGFSKWKPRGEFLRLLGAGRDLEITGLENISQNQYKTITDGFFSLKFGDPFLFVAEQL